MILWNISTAYYYLWRLSDQMLEQKVALKVATAIFNFNVQKTLNILAAFVRRFHTKNI